MIYYKIERIVMEMSNQMGKLIKNNILARYFPVLIVLCVGILLSTLLFNVVRGWEQNHVQEEFLRASKNRIETLNKEIEFNLDTLEGLQALYFAANKVERYEFHLAAKVLLSHENSLQAVEWIPRVADSQRQEYEEKAKRDGFKKFQFMEKDADGQLVRAAKREEYFPVYFVEPYEGNELALGFDLSSNPELRKSLNLPRDSGNMTVTPRITVVQETGKQYGFMVFLPVYKKNTPTASLEERRKNLKGFLLAVFRVGDIVEAALSRLKSAGIDIIIFDDSAQKNKRFLYFHPSRFGDGLTGPVSYKEANQLKGLHYMAPLIMGDRNWLVVFKPTPRLIAFQKSGQPLIVLTGGLLTTAILSSYVWFIFRAGTRARTSAEKLLQTKNGLEREMEYRKKIQKEREELLHDLNERLKELNCLYKISNLIMRHGITLNEIFQEAVGFFPESWQYPDITCARIIFEEQIFKTDNYKDTEWKQSAEIMVHGEEVGVVEVYYIEKKPELDEGPFTREERNLIDSIAIQLGSMLERKSAEVNLETARSYADNIIGSSIDMIITVDGDRKIVEFNKAAEKTFGYKKEEVLGKTIEILYVSEEEAAKPVEDIKRKGHFFGEVLNKKKNGDIFPSYVSASFIQDKKGGFLGAMGISRDITKQKEVERSLRESEMKFRSVAQSATDAIISADSNGNIISWNNGAARIFGYNNEEVLHKPLTILMPEKYREAHKEGIKRVLLTGEKKVIGKTVELEGVHKNGNEFPMELSISTWKTGKGTFFTGILRDITERKKAESELNFARIKAEKAVEALKSTLNVSEELRNEADKAHSNMSQLMAAIPTVLIGLNHKREITMWNNVAGKIFSIENEDIFTDPMESERGILFYECDINWNWSRIRKLIDTCDEINDTLHLDDIDFKSKDGKEGFMNLTVTPVFSDFADGKNFLVLGIDTTERKILEIHLSHAQKLESIGSLASGIAHEINTPTQFVSDNIHFLKESFEDINSLLSKYAKLLAASKDGSVADDLIRDIESVVEETDIDFLQKEIPKAIQASQRGTNRVSTIVKAMKEFSHPGTKEKTLTDINKAIESTLTVSKNEWKYVAELLTDFDQKLPLVPCLPGDFNQVILNLITNAAYAISKVIKDGSENKGTITIRTRKDDDFAEITISDTGSGVPDSIKNKIFLPFFTTKEVGKGTGQGLAISHSVIVDKHKGTLSFESEEGKGSIFTIRIPLEGKSK